MGTGGGKTQVIFEIIDQELSRVPNLDEAAAIFIVNNNIILSEAGKKFQDRYETAYSKSHAHGGKHDISGNVVFTTPGSLLGDDRLEKLCAGKKYLLLINDETHHLPANQLDEIFKRATALSEAAGIDVKVLGVTATETRPDLKQVLAYFHDHISYEKSAAELTARGFLVPFKYHAHDAWMYPGRDAPAVLLPDDDFAPERRHLLNSEAAFPHVQAALDAHVLPKEDRRTLVVAPSVDLAGSFCAYLNQNPTYQGGVVRLTAADKQRDPERFSDTYEAWKKGTWPEGSKYAHEPVPKIVVAVDLFKEGTDAPGIQTLVNWADTNSLITFLQTLGRGLRPDEFKTHLDVIDIAGTFRKVHLLQWLGDAAAPRDEKEGAPKERDLLDKEPSSSGRPLCELSEEVSVAVRSFLADVPATLARRYPGRHYSALPAPEIDRLHACLAERCGFTTHAEFEQFLTRVGQRLVQDTSLTEAKRSRAELLAAFYQFIDDAPPNDVRREQATLLVHAHLLENLQILVPEFTPAHFTKVFPEFSAESLDNARVVGGNLAILRHRHFKLNPHAMVEKLLKDVVSTRIITDPAIAFELQQMAVRAEDADFSFASAENRRTRGDPSSGITPDQYDQIAILTAYLEHPSIKGKLTESDFLLARKDFENRLIIEGLISPDSTAIDSQAKYLRFLTSRLTDLEKVLGGEGLGDPHAAIRVVEAMLSDPALATFLDQVTLTGTRFNSLSTLRDTFMQHAETYPRLNAVSTALDELLGRACDRETVEVRGGTGLRLTTERIPDSSDLRVITERHLESGQQTTVSESALTIKPEFSRTHLLMTNSSAASIAGIFDTLSSADKAEFSRVLALQLERAAHRMAFREGATSITGLTAPVPVVVLPSAIGESKGTFSHDLRSALLKHTSVDVLIGGPKVASAPPANNLEPTVGQCLMTRIEGLTEDALRGLRQTARSSSSKWGTFAKDLLHAYEVTHFVRTRVAPHAVRWSALFASASSNEASFDGAALRHIEIARQPFTRLIDGTTTIQGSRFNSLKSYCSLLDSITASGSFTSDSALLAAAWTVWDRFPFGKFEQRSSPLRELNSDFPAFFSRIVRAQANGIPIPLKEQASIRSALTTVVDALHAVPFDLPATLPGVDPADQETEAKLLHASIRTISETLQELLTAQAKSAPNAQQGSPASVERKEGHPYFTPLGDPVVFLSGTKKVPVVHIDPNCAALTKDLTTRKRRELPPGPVTPETLESELGFGYQDKAKCCPGCKTPTWNDQELYADVAKRFRYNAATSAVLPTS